MRKLLFSVAALVLGIAVSFLLFELGLRVASLFATFDPALSGRRDSRLVVLCIGDSHTWGNGRGYPSRLSEVLAERSDSVLVVNLGIPGTNTAQLRERLPRSIESVQPDVLVVWAGINNLWNPVGTEDWTQAGVEEAPLSERLLVGSRVWRFFRAWQQQRKLGRQLADAESYVVAAQTRRPEDPRRMWRIELLGHDEVVVNESREKRELADVARGTEFDLFRVVEEAESRALPILLVTYPQYGDAYQTVNRAIEKVAAETDAVLIVGADATHRIRARNRAAGEPAGPLLDRSIHPTQELYDEIGDLMIEAMDARGLIPPAPSARLSAASLPRTAREAVAPEAPPGRFRLRSSGRSPRAGGRSGAPDS